MSSIKLVGNAIPRRTTARLRVSTINMHISRQPSQGRLAAALGWAEPADIALPRRSGRPSCMSGDARSGEPYSRAELRVAALPLKIRAQLRRPKSLPPRARAALVFPHVFPRRVACACSEQLKPLP